jgi:hypothetical protein
MAWENKIIKFEIIKCSYGSTVPVDWIFLSSHVEPALIGTITIFYYHKPIYKKVNVKRK